MYVPYVNTVAQGPGFNSLVRAQSYFAQSLDTHRALKSILIIGQTYKSANGTRSHTYHWATGKWIAGPHDCQAAYLLACANGQA